MMALWIVMLLLSACILVLAIVVVGLARQIGILHERSAPLGALVTTNAGFNSLVPRGPWDTILGQTIELPLAEDRNTLLMFVSTTCPVCKKLLPIVADMKKSETSGFDIVFASDGSQEDHLKFYHKNNLEGYPYILSSQLGKLLQIDHLPHMVLVNPGGAILSRGLVNSREQIESLIIAAELGHPTVQSFLTNQQNFKSNSNLG